jgi:alkylation response protein AidB-like acyl-CoA dehydrogenase
MELNLSPSEEAFRQEFAAWLQANLPDGVRASKLLTLADDEAFAIRRSWARTMGEAGWLGLSWPKEFGGRGATAMEQVIYLWELRAHDAPGPIDMLGLDMVGPTLIDTGNDEQKRKFLPPMIRGEVMWCQGFSEPNAGSDLAGLQTRADRDGDEWVINGQKIWNSEGHHADWCTVLARTDQEAPKHKGITFFLVEMKTPGISLRPIRQITGDADFNELFLDNVRVPSENILGEVNGGWLVANRFLAYERGVITMSMLMAFQQQWDELRDYARTTRRNGTLLAEDPRVRERLAATYTNIELMRLANLRYITHYMRGGPPGAETSIMKLHWASTEQALTDLSMALAGPAGLATVGSPAAVGDWNRKYLFSRAVTIYGGTQDIQRNIIADRIFGLPRG